MSSVHHFCEETQYLMMCNSLSTFPGNPGERELLEEHNLAIPSTHSHSCCVGLPNVIQGMCIFYFYFTEGA